METGLNEHFIVAHRYITGPAQKIAVSEIGSAETRLINNRPFTVMTTRDGVDFTMRGEIDGLFHAFRVAGVRTADAIDSQRLTYLVVAPSGARLIPEAA